MLTQTHVFPSLLEIAEPYPAVCLDAYGVFWGGGSAGILPGSLETMRKLVASGKIVGILSNSTQVAEKEIAKLDGHGMRKGEHFHFLITSGEVTRQIALERDLPFPTPHNSYYVMCRNHPRSSPHLAIFKNTPYQEMDKVEGADFIYVGIPHLDGKEQTDPQVFLNEVRRLRGFKLPMLCANPDRFAPEGNRYVVTQGSIAELYRSLGGEVFFVGKPTLKVFQVALEQFNRHIAVDCKNVLMVGDTPETDVRGARQAGMTAVLVTQTGNMADRIRDQGLEKTIQALPETDQPHFYIQRMASHGI